MPTEASNSVAGTLEQLPESATNTASRRSRTHLFATLGLVFVIVFGAWLISGREGLDQLGRGGVNEHLLPRAGDQAPDVTITDILGISVSLSSFRGQTVWLNFWG